MMRNLTGLLAVILTTSAVVAGGITATDDGRILLLDRSAGLFLVNSDETIRLDVELPRNGANFLQEQLDEGDFGNVLDASEQLRYSDVMIARDGANRALVVSYTEFHIDESCFTSTLAKYVLPAGQVLDDIKITSDDWIDLARASPCLEPFEDELPTFGLKAGGRVAQYDGDTEKVIWSVGDDAEVMEVNLSDGDYRVIARGR
ncbi:hypothetical protein N9L47_06985 [Rhodobacteraceae bacterium]|nr:hypothetical protein [Paracoccaceae bacterium]